MVNMGKIGKQKPPSSCPDTPSSILNVCPKMLTAVDLRPPPPLWGRVGVGGSSAFLGNARFDLA